MCAVGDGLAATTLHAQPWDGFPPVIDVHDLFYCAMVGCSWFNIALMESILIDGELLAMAAFALPCLFTLLFLEHMTCRRVCSLGNGTATLAPASVGLPLYLHRLRRGQPS